MTRIDHTGHSHSNTTAARQACRKSVADAQRAYLLADAGEIDWDTYTDKIEWMSMDWGITYTEMRNVVENGPVIR
jgi:hypothetical protein